MRGHGVAKCAAALVLCALVRLGERLSPDNAGCGDHVVRHRVRGARVRRRAVARRDQVDEGTRIFEPDRPPWPRPGRGGAGPALRGVAPWLGLTLVVVAWEVLGIDTGPHQYHLTISALAQAYRPLNAALLLVWVLVGIGL